MCHYQKIYLKLNYLEHSADVDKMSTKEGKKPRTPVKDGIRTKRKKGRTRSSEYQTLKSWGKGHKRKSWKYQEYELPR